MLHRVVTCGQSWSSCKVLQLRMSTTSISTISASVTRTVSARDSSIGSPLFEDVLPNRRRAGSVTAHTSDVHIKRTNACMLSVPYEALSTENNYSPHAASTWENGSS
ncbi:hypothetical protein PYCCODRAFT_603575 [Trametes coccinea BRFM310]|uniref:Uncharacterized protein n=1 Tax=Trametes coccinea (strain BRFM310) TaxID=1353009 RepID=A0A1Y2J1V8_TRAC3|nr:hypothetical protein PYCCODRAFT_603575 [Trametes coccinea BRFM310]